MSPTDFAGRPRGARAAVSIPPFLPVLRAPSLLPLHVINQNIATVRLLKWQPQIPTATIGGEFSVRSGIFEVAGERQCDAFLFGVSPSFASFQPHPSSLGSFLFRLPHTETAFSVGACPPTPRFRTCGGDWPTARLFRSRCLLTPRPRTGLKRRRLR